MPNPRMTEESRRVYKCDGERLSGLTWYWSFKIIWNISSSRHIIFKIHPRVSHTIHNCYCGDISTPRNVTLNETNCDWLFDMSVTWPWPMNAAIYSRPSAVSLKSGYARLTNKWLYWLWWIQNIQPDNCNLIQEQMILRHFSFQKHVWPVYSESRTNHSHDVLSESKTYSMM